MRAAWLLGFLLSLGFSYSIEAIRVDLNSTHYTLTCAYDYSNTVGIVTQQIRPLLMYVLPNIILICTCTSIWRMLCKRQITAGGQNSLEMNRKWCIRRKKATIQLMAIIIAFTVPCSIFFLYAVLKSIFVPSIEFKTDYTIRAVATLFVYLNGPANFLIHLSQLIGFRKAVQGYLSCLKCECKLGRTRTMKMNHTVHEERKAAPAVKGEKYNERRASLSQVQDAVPRQETRRHSC